MKKSFLLPEWAHTRAITVAWPFPSSDWSGNLIQAQACYADMVTAFAQVVPVWLLVHPSVNLITVKTALMQRNADLERVQLIDTIVYNDTWLRDYGPLSCSEGYIKFEFNGWGGKYAAPDDNRVALYLAQLLGQNPNCCPLVCEGGGLESNGKILLVNQDCIVDDARNLAVTKQEMELALREWLGVEAVEWLHNIQLTGDDTDGHIDTIARFVSESRIVYSGLNSDHVDAQSLERLHQQLTEIAARRNWQLFSLPTPSYCSLLDSRALPATYANFLICNHHLFVPVYGLPEDEVALKILGDACPEYTLIPVRCEALLEQHGSLHCATMQIIDLNNPGRF
ncbi:MAG TPA: agmatine deiminase family protein [Cellvibrionaceae bacterium]